MTDRLVHPGDLVCSVIVPVYNGAGTIERCLNALAVQTLPPERYEVVVVNDGSTDATVQVIEQWSLAHPQVQLSLVSQPNAGPAAARNHGVAESRAPLLLFTDADCAPAPNWIEQLCNALRGPDQPVGVMGAYQSTQVEPAARFAQYEFEERYAHMASFSHVDLIATYSAGFQRTKFIEIGGFDTGFPEANNEDVELSYRLSRAAGRMNFVPTALVDHSHDCSWLAYGRTKFRRGFWRMQVYRRYPEKAIQDSYTPQLLKLQIALAGLLALGTLLALLMRSMRWLWLAVPFLVSTLPSVRFVMRREPMFALWVPWGIWIRSIALGLGIAWSLLDTMTNARRAKQKRADAPHVF